MIFENGYSGYCAPKNELESVFKVGTTMSQLDSQFHTWWHDEGKFQVPPTKDYNAVKELCKIAFINGAYAQEELLTKPK